MKIPLDARFAHDLPKMTAAAKDGLIYVCNPNNPTASLTPKDEVREFIKKTPRQTAILVDEAYHHYVDSPDYESVIPLIKDHPNLIVARTFSKIYGMAGMRCGYCVAQRETIERMRPHQLWDSVNIMALVAAIANLNDPDQVANGRRLNSEARAFVIGELDKMGYKQIPSQANFIMFDVKRPVVPLIQAIEAAQRAGRPIIPRPAEPHAPHHRQENRDGSVSGSVSPGNSVIAGLTQRPQRSPRRDHWNQRMPSARCVSRRSLGVGGTFVRSLVSLSGVPSELPRDRSEGRQLLKSVFSKPALSVRRTTTSAGPDALTVAARGCPLSNPSSPK